MENPKITTKKAVYLGCNSHLSFLFKSIASYECIIPKNGILATSAFILFIITNQMQWRNHLFALFRFFAGIYQKFCVYFSLHLWYTMQRRCLPGGGRTKEMKYVSGRFLLTGRRCRAEKVAGTCRFSMRFTICFITKGVFFWLKN